MAADLAAIFMREFLGTLAITWAVQQGRMTIRPLQTIDRHLNLFATNPTLLADRQVNVHDKVIEGRVYRGDTFLQPLMVAAFVWAVVAPRD